MRNIGFTLSPALAAGKVDAVIGAYWNIELVDLERQGQPVAALRLDEHGVPSYDELVVVTSDAVARDKPELVRAFLRGLRTGQDWAATDQAGAVKHLLDANKDLDEETVAAQLDVTADVLSPSDVPTLHRRPGRLGPLRDLDDRQRAADRAGERLGGGHRRVPAGRPLSYQVQPGPQVRVMVGIVPVSFTRM